MRKRSPDKMKRHHSPQVIFNNPILSGKKGKQIINEVNTTVCRLATVNTLNSRETS